MMNNLVIENIITYKHNNISLKMDFYLNLNILLNLAKLYSTKTNKLKSLEICNISENTLKKYTKEEFIAFKLEDKPVEKLVENPGLTMKEKFCVIYNLTKEKLNNNNDIRLIKLNNLLKSLNESEEDELLDVITITMTNPSGILYDLI